MGMTMAEKILARKSGRSAVRPGEYVWASVDGAGLFTIEPKRIQQKMEQLGIDRVFDPDRIYLVEDHFAPSPNVEAANAYVGVREFARTYKIPNFFEWGRHGILHELFPHHGFCSPGDLVLTMDSHSTSYGCFNVASTAVVEELAFVVITGKIWLRVPESIRFTVTGRLPGPEGFVVGKDVILHIAGKYGTDVGLYRSIEFDGPAVRSMSMDSRFSMSNMGVELGGKFAIFPCDEKTNDWLRPYLRRPPNPVEPDADARYEASYTVDVSSLPPYVARPHDPGNAVPVTEVARERITINQAFLGSCTNARMEDFRMAARILKGRKVAASVRLIATPASQAIWNQCVAEGIWQVFADAEAMVTNAGCGACPGVHLGVLGDEEVCISSSNRNFQGRMGSPKASVYLANPATVAASAVAGYIEDPRNFL